MFHRKVKNKNVHNFSKTNENYPKLTTINNLNLISRYNKNHSIPIAKNHYT